MIEDKQKIIDLWHYKRQQKKNRSKRVRLIRISVFCLILVVAIIVIMLFYQRYSKPISFEVFGPELSKQERNILDKHFSLAGEYHLPFFHLNKNSLRHDLLDASLFLEDLELKSNFLPGQPHLTIKGKRTLPWARFMNGWLLTSTGKIIADTGELDLRSLRLISRTVIMASSQDLDYLSDKGLYIQRLIFAVNQQLPELSLKSVSLLDRDNITLYFPDLVIELGEWGQDLFQQRIPSLYPVYLELSDDERERVTRIDLSSTDKAKISFEQRQKDI